jgi:RNase P/RNase MRP subunit POP5
MEKQKRLKLKPSARENRRYLIIAEKDNVKIERAILDYLGVLGFAKSAYMKVLENNGKTISAVTREELEKVKAALASAGIKIEKISGTLKGLE